MKIERVPFERIIIITDIKKSQDAIDYCIENNYLMIASAPVPIRGDRRNATEFRVVAEKRIDNE